MTFQNNEVLRLYVDENVSVNKISKLLKLDPFVIRRSLLDQGVEYTTLFIDQDWVLKSISLFKEGLNYSQIAKEVGKTPSHIRGVLLERGYIDTKFPNTSEETIASILQLYSEGLSCKQVATQLNVTATTVKKFLPKEVKMKKQFYNTYSCNYSFFDNIDNEVKAYFLGLFYADGYNDQKKGAIHLGFAEKDRELVDKFKEAIEATHLITLQNRKDPGNAQPFYRISINSRPLSDSLARHGCVQAKTHLLDKLPEMEEPLIRHFIRGYFDGDGSAYYTKSRNWDRLNLSFTGSKPFLEDIQAYLIKELEATKTAIYITHPDRNNLIGDLRYANGIATKVHDWMYSDCQYYSERKKNIPAVKKQKDEDYKNSVLEQINLFQLN